MTGKNVGRQIRQCKSRKHGDGQVGGMPLVESGCYVNGGAGDRKEDKCISGCVTLRKNE